MSHRFVALAMLLPLLAACSESVSPRAERVFYRGDGSASWGTVCRLNTRGFLGMGERGYVSVAHVTENGTPQIGPKDAVTVSDAASDWSFLGIDPAKLDAEDYPPMRAGMAVTIHGFPARDRDGEIVSGMAYLDDPMPPFWWIELRDADDGIEAEGVIGGFSGSCVFDEGDNLVAVVHANGFSEIAGTTHTWAKVVPVREAIRQAQRRGEPVVSETVVAASPPPVIAPAPVPPMPDPIARADEAAPPIYIEVTPTYLDTAPAPAPPPVYQDIAPPPVYRDIAPPPMEAASARTVIASPAPQVVPPEWRVIPAPRSSYRPRGIDCPDCI